MTTPQNIKLIGCEHVKCLINSGGNWFSLQFMGHIIALFICIYVDSIESECKGLLPNTLP